MPTKPMQDLRTANAQISKLEAERDLLSDAYAELSAFCDEKNIQQMIGERDLQIMRLEIENEKLRAENKELNGAVLALSDAVYESKDQSRWQRAWACLTQPAEVRS